MHWARVIRESDNPEWTGVVHADGTFSEVKVGIFNDQVHVRIDCASGKKVCIQQDRDDYVDDDY
jgi:hypothetical protein